MDKEIYLTMGNTFLFTVEAKEKNNNLTHVTATENPTKLAREAAWIEENTITFTLGNHPVDSLYAVELTQPQEKNYLYGPQ